MLISEASKIANLTKKAIEYYTEQQLICPTVSENGYRAYSEGDVERLQKISVLRKLGISTQDIKAVLADNSNNTLQRISVLKELNSQREQAKNAILDRLSVEISYAEATEELGQIERSITISEKLLDAFPGYYGRFICLHFAQFLNEPITSKEQLIAYGVVIEFLDNVPSMDFPEDLQTFLDESSTHFSAEAISGILKNKRQSIENPEKFLAENREMLEHYMAYKQSDEFKNSPVNRLQTMLKEFNSASGYYDIFIPAMKRLSKPYAEYCNQMEIVSEKMLSQYPEIKQIE